MDIITKSQVDSFVDKYGISSTKTEAVKFEYFVAYSLLSHEVIGILSKDDLDKISTGAAKGVDSIAMCINEKLVFNSGELENYKNQSMSVDMYFIQSKASNHFDDAHLGNFTDVVFDFFRDKPLYSIPQFKPWREIYLRLLKNIGNVRKVNLHCFYVTLGSKQSGNTSMASTISAKTKLLKDLALFEKISIDLVDKSRLMSKYKRAVNPLVASFEFKDKIQLTGIKDVQSAFIGFIPYLEFRKLIMDDEQDKIKSLFNDNLRDFLGMENSVNKAIKSTLESGNYNEFSLLNNGVTVIADENLGAGNSFRLENYQIVNGCQTSNVLYECKDLRDIDKALIPLKVVITKNSALRDSIILSTNSQSKITEEQLLALTEFQKQLEDYYNANSSIDRLYYERRTNQYASQNIPRTNIIEIKEQLKSFMAMFMDIPHVVAGNIGKVIKKHSSDFFQKDHSPLPYYISGLMSSKWSKLSKDDEGLSSFNKYRYHIFMAVRRLVEEVDFSRECLQSTSKYCTKEPETKRDQYNRLLDYIRSDRELNRLFLIAIDILKKSDYDRPKKAYSKPITEDYILNIERYKANGND